MIRHKPYAEIENHVTKLKIKGWENYKSDRHMESKLKISDIVDGKRFSFETTGKMTIAEIVDEICKAAQNEH